MLDLHVTAQRLVAPALVDVRTQRLVKDGEMTVYFRVKWSGIEMGR